RLARRGHGRLARLARDEAVRAGVGGGLELARGGPADDRDPGDGLRPVGEDERFGRDLLAHARDELVERDRRLGPADEPDGAVADPAELLEVVEPEQPAQ